jgi:hypothetical protein
LVQEVIKVIEKHATEPFILGYRIFPEESSLENGLQIDLRLRFKEGYIEEAIHDELKVLRTPEDIIESITAEEI